MLSIQQRFNLLGKLILTKDYLTTVLQKMPEQYTIYDLTRKGVISVIKRDEVYLNMSYETGRTPWVLGAAYCGDSDYMFGGMAIYNLYGFTTQIANQYMIYSDIFYGDKQIHTSYFTFKKVKKELLYGFEEKFDRGIYYKRMTIERAFIEFCKENKEKKQELIAIYKSSIDKIELNKLLKKYPYQTVKSFILNEIVAGA